MIHFKKITSFTHKQFKHLIQINKQPFLSLKIINHLSTQNNPKQTPTKPSLNNSTKQSQNLNNNTNPQSNKSTTQNSINQQPSFSPEQQNLIKSYQPDELFNTILNVDPNHNFQKDLIVAKKNYQKTTKQLRASILFEDLLKSQAQIIVYDTKGKPYTHMWMKNLFNIFFFGLTVWFFKSYADSDPKNKVILERTTAGKGMQYILYGFAGWFLLVGFYRYLRFQRRFVQKIIYDTKSDNFILTKRGFFGGSKPIQISRFKIVYTQNEFLNKKGTNYFNLDTKQQFSIPYKQSWIKQDLFSHLIAQRIRI